MPHTLAQCCNPRFPSEVVAVMRSGGKCMVHTAQCRALNRVNPARFLPAYWSAHEVGIIVPMTIIVRDRPGFLADVTKALYQA
jgi:(p)ppGpp synthase/HD superfamily hydrolase